MKKQHILITGIALTLIALVIYIQKGGRNSDNSTSGNLAGNLGTSQGDANHPGSAISPSTETSAASSNHQKSGATGVTSDQNESPADQVTKTEPVKKENNCFSFSYQHQPKNQGRDIEEFLNDTNAFPIPAANVNQKSICVKVNDKPVNHKFVKKGSKSEVIIGSVVGPESTIQVSYCVGSVPCKESCVVKTKNKVDELLNDSEMGGLENAELETQVKELRNVASVHGDLMDSTIIRDWKQLQTKEWVCSK